MEEVIKLGKQIARDRNENLYMTEEDLDKIYRDDYAINQYEKGITEGLEKGIKQGKKQGIEQGTIQGEYNKSLEIAKNLLKKEMPDKSIIEIVGITKEELDKIKKELEK